MTRLMTRGKRTPDRGCPCEIASSGLQLRSTMRVVSWVTTNQSAGKTPNHSSPVGAGPFSRSQARTISTSGHLKQQSQSEGRLLPQQDIDNQYPGGLRTRKRNDSQLRKQRQIIRQAPLLNDFSGLYLTHGDVAERHATACRR